ncbi:hypothetical protein DUNSADRAFT_8323 [Dunaliella salina]|uniref:Encoded protein n=1 Tax=Dunaliella salina TaxID=3046 RepID=A0ABQ7H5W9_DUNSA|nr:hypothetical protein DUNSADRAFT_8323 [Dunaliella salina]|eukprot:KAF5842260.1 hypothetical protein DUNSADRAFT_8323 [Dunaliella salina]
MASYLTTRPPSMASLSCFTKWPCTLVTQSKAHLICTIALLKARTWSAHKWLWPRECNRWAAVLDSPYYKSPYHLYQWSVRSLGEWLFPRLQWLDAAFDRVLKEVGPDTGASADGEPGWEQAVMDAAVAAADAEAQSATAFGGAGVGAAIGAEYGQDAQSYAIRERLALLRRAAG